MTHKHPTRDDPRCVDVGSTACLSPFTNSVGDDPAGFIFAHDREGFDGRCEGAVNVVPFEGRPVWSMSGTLAGGDLTLSPSILCKAKVPVWHEDTGRYTLEPPECGFHGFVRNGAWVPA